jgi:membrane-bound lytic murein transglycosylase D
LSWRVKILRFFLLVFFVFSLSACEHQTQSLKDDQSIKKVDDTDYKKIDSKFHNDDNLWKYISNRYSLNGYDHPSIKGHILWFQKNPDYLTRVTKRAKPYLHYVVQKVEQAGLPMEIALLPIVESAYYPFAFSGGAASGLWQFIPSTGRLYGLKEDWWHDDRRDFMLSTNAAIAYYKNLKTLFDGDMHLAIAAYNGGPGRVQRAIKRNQKMKRKTDFWSLKLPSETKGYVPRLLAIAELIKNPEKYGQNITYVKNEPYISTIKLRSQIDLALVSEFTGLTIEEIYKLNTGLKRWATPGANYELVLPIDKIKVFEEKLKKYPKNKRISWVRYQVKSGDNLISLAKRHNTSVESIRTINNLSDNKIVVDKYLLIPQSLRNIKDYAFTDDKLGFSGKKVNKLIKKLHTVEEGDSLWSISRTYDVSMKDIIRWNRLNSKKHLQIGTELKIFIERVDELNVTALQKVIPDLNKSITYKVKKGDNLSLIAKKFNTSIEDIVRDNKIDLKKPLKIGKKLKIIVNILSSDE